MPTKRNPRIRNVRFDSDHQNVVIYTSMGRIRVDLDTLAVKIAIRPHKANQVTYLSVGRPVDTNGHKEYNFAVERTPKYQGVLQKVADLDNNKTLTKHKT